MYYTFANITKTAFLSCLSYSLIYKFNQEKNTTLVFELKKRV